MSVKRPHDKSESTVIVPPVKKSKIGDDAIRNVLTLSCDQMAVHDLKILRSLSKEDQRIFASLLQWQRILNMVSFMNNDSGEVDCYEFSLLHAELGKRGIGPLAKDWTWSSPLPVLPNFSAENFPPFSSFEIENIPVEEESTLVAKLCAEQRNPSKPDAASEKDSPAKDPAATQTTYQTAQPLKLRSDTRCERERLLMDMASSRLFKLAFSTEPSTGSSHYDISSDAILWSVDFTFHLDTKDGPKEETFTLDDTSEKDLLKGNIDNVIYFDDAEDSITNDFKKATERSESCFNVFFVTPSVVNLNTEPQYYLINAEDTLLEAVRGKLVVDRPRFLIALKSQSMQFLNKKPQLDLGSSFASTNAVPATFSFAGSSTVNRGFAPTQFNQPPPFISSSNVFVQPNIQPAPAPFAQPSLSQPTGAGLMGPVPFNFRQFLPNVVPTQNVFGPPQAAQAPSIFGPPQGIQPQSIFGPPQGVQVQSIFGRPQGAQFLPPANTPLFNGGFAARPVVVPTAVAPSGVAPAVVGPAFAAASVAAPSGVISSAAALPQTSQANATATPVSRANLVVLTDTTAKKAASENVANTNSTSAAKKDSNGDVAKLSSASTTANKDSGDEKAKIPSTSDPTSTANVVMRPVTAKQGSGTKFTPEQMAKRDLEKLLKYPWNVQKELLFKLPLNRALNIYYHTRGTKHNNIRALLPTRFHSIGIDKIPPGWQLDQQLPMLSGFNHLRGVIPIKGFEIDEAADDANFEQVAKILGVRAEKAMPKRTQPSSSSASDSSQSKIPSSSAKQTTAQAKATNAAKPDEIRLLPSEMAHLDYVLLKDVSLSVLKSTIYRLPLDRLVNLGYHLKRYPLPKRERTLGAIKSLLFGKLADMNVAKLPPNWTLKDDIPARGTQRFGKVPEVFVIKKIANEDQLKSFTWPGLPKPAEAKEGTSTEKVAAPPAKLVPRSVVKPAEKKQKEKVQPSSAKPLDLPKTLTEGDLPKFFPGVEMLLKKARSDGVHMFISADTEGAQAQSCKCQYDASTDCISWTVMIKLEVCENGKLQEEVFHVDNVYGGDSLQSILRNFIFGIVDRRHSLADKFKQTLKDDEMKFIEMSMLLPVIKEKQMMQLKRIAVDHTLSLNETIKAKELVDCPRFIARNKQGFKHPTPPEEVIEVDCPLFVFGGNLQTTTAPAPVPSTFKDVVKNTAMLDSAVARTPAEEAMDIEEVAFMLTTNQVASNDRDTLKTLSWDDQKLLISLMPWDRLVALIELLRTLPDENDTKNLLVLCNLRLEKLGIGPLPDDWSTSAKVPVLPGHSSTSFPTFTMFSMAEVPLISKTISDVKYLAEEVTTLSSSVDVPRLHLRFEASSHPEQRLITQAADRGIHFAFFLDSQEQEEHRSHYDFASRTIMWSVEVTFFKDNNTELLRETEFLHGVSENITLNEMTRQAVLQFSKRDNIQSRFGSTILDEATRFIEVLYVVPRIPSSKFDVERYQHVKLSSSIMENLKEKLVIDHPQFVIVLKDQLNRLSSKIITNAEEKALFDFEESQRTLAKPPVPRLQYLNLIDMVYMNLTEKRDRLRAPEAPSSETQPRKKKSTVPSTPIEPHLQSPAPFEVPPPANRYYGPRKVLPHREMTFNELKNAEDMVSLACHRSRDVVVKPIHSMRSVTFLSHVAQHWGYKLKEEISVDPSGTTKVLVHFEGLPRLVTLGQCEGNSLISATVGAHSCAMAAFCYMLVIPFEMWKTVMNGKTDDWIDTIIYACRERFAHLLTLIYSGEYLKLVEFSGDFETEMPAEVFTLWQRLIHIMRTTGIEYWKKNKEISIPNGIITTTDLTAYKGTYFRFSKAEGVIDWASMKPRTGWNSYTTTIRTTEPVALARYCEQEYEKGLLPERQQNSDVPRCPTTGAENWYETVTALPEDPLVQITARDCETRGDNVGAWWINPVNSRLIEEISRRLKSKLVRTHLIQWESNSQFTNWFHFVNVKFEDIAPFFVQGLGKHVSARRASDIAESYVISSFCRMGIIPLELYNLIRKFGEEWIDPVLYACRERFAFLQRVIRNPVFFSLNTLAKADLYKTASHCGPLSKFSLAYEFARRMRDTALQYWSEHQILCIPKSISLPSTHFPVQYFIFVSVEGFERWGDFNPPPSEVKCFGNDELLPVLPKLPPWEKTMEKERGNIRCPPPGRECRDLRDDGLCDDEAANMRQFVESMARSVSRKLLIHEEQGSSLFYFEIKFSHESGDLLYGKAVDANEQVAYKTALSILYQKLLKSAFVLPSLLEFVARRFQTTGAFSEECAMARLPYVESVIKPMLQRFEIFIRRYRALITGCEKFTRKRHNEQLLSIVRRLNQDTWRTHPIFLPLHLFIDYEDPENCRTNLQNFVQILEPSTVWISDIKINPASSKNDVYARYEYALTMSDLRNENVTVTLDDDVENPISTQKQPPAKLIEPKDIKVEPAEVASTKNAATAKSTSSSSTNGDNTTPVPTEVLPKKLTPIDEQPTIILPWEREQNIGGADEGNDAEEEEGDEYLD